jgi:hypothetical protein
LDESKQDSNSVKKKAETKSVEPNLKSDSPKTETQTQTAPSQEKASTESVKTAENSESKVTTEKASAGADKINQKSPELSSEQLKRPETTPVNTSSEDAGVSEKATIATSAANSNSAKPAAQTVSAQDVVKESGSAEKAPSVSQKAGETTEAKAVDLKASTAKTTSPEVASKVEKLASSEQKANLNLNQQKDAPVIERHQSYGKSVRPGPDGNVKADASQSKSADRAEISQPQQQKGDTVESVKEDLKSATAPQPTPGTTGKDSAANATKTGQASTQAAQQNQATSNPAAASGASSANQMAGSTETVNQSQHVNRSSESAPKEAQQQRGSATDKAILNESGQVKESPKENAKAEKQQKPSLSSAFTDTKKTAGSEPVKTATGQTNPTAPVTSGSTVEDGQVQPSENAQNQAQISEQRMQEALKAQWIRKDFPQKIIQLAQTATQNTQKQGAEFWHKHRFVFDQGKALTVAVNKQDGRLQVQITGGSQEVSRMLQQYSQEIRQQLQEKFDLQVDIQFNEDQQQQQEQGQKNSAGGQSGSGGIDSRNLTGLNEVQSSERSVTEETQQSGRSTASDSDENEWTG